MKVNNYLIKANGKEYFLNYSISAFMMLERTCGVKMIEILKNIEQAQENGSEGVSFETLFYLLKAGLDRGMNKNHSDFEIYDFQQDLELEFGIEKAYDKVLSIIDKSLNSEKAKRQQEYINNNRKNSYNKGKSKKK
ncbi:MAG: hypothetical protein MSA15_21280 [Clostridium sp.]|nr:hypothetical protein [Clostridium sp.]